MKCVLCGQPTGRFLRSHHQDCVAKFKNQWYLMAKAIDEYNLGIKCWVDAKLDFVNLASESHVQKFFWHNIYTRSEIRTNDKLVFSQSMICAGEEKPSRQKNYNYQCIAKMGTIALSNSGVYIIGEKTHYIPYGKIVDIGLDKPFWSKDRVYFDVYTTSANRHRYTVEAEDKKDKNLVIVLYEILRFMVGKRDEEFKNHLTNTHPSPLDYMFTVYPSELSFQPLTKETVQETAVHNTTVPCTPAQAIPANNIQRHKWTIEEDALCCRRFFEQYVIQQSTMDLQQFAEQLHLALPSISIGSLKMKTQNIKQLCIENGIRNSLDAKPLVQYSKQNYHAFLKVRKEFEGMSL